MTRFKFSLRLAFAFMAISCLARTTLADCKSLSGNVMFLDFDNSVEEVAAARTSAASKCQKFTLVQSQAQLDSSLKTVDASKQGISSLILSGHHKFGVFWGKNFFKTAGGVGAAFDEYPALKANISNLYLWGCYTNNRDKAADWLGMFPNVDHIFGYSLKAPLSSQGTGVEYLTNALTYQDELDKAKSMADVKTLLDKNVIPGGSPDFQFVNAAIYGRSHCSDSRSKGHGYYYAVDQIEGGKTNSSITEFSDHSQCDSLTDVYKQTIQQQLLEFWNGKKEVLALEDPKSKDPAANPVRTTLYPWINKNSYCFASAKFPIDSTTTLSGGQLLNLVYFQTIKANFFKYFHNDISEALQKMKDPALSASLTNPGSLTRAQIIEIQTKLANQTSASEVSTNLAAKMKSYLVDLDDRCADIHWLEDDTSQIPAQSKFCTQSL